MNGELTQRLTLAKELKHTLDNCASLWEALPTEVDLDELAHKAKELLDILVSAKDAAERSTGIR